MFSSFIPGEKYSFKVTISENPNYEKILLRKNNLTKMKKSYY